jgi:hypothetical protein
VGGWAGLAWPGWEVFSLFFCLKLFAFVVILWLLLKHFKIVLIPGNY